jgi:hypothetical protein
LKPNNVPNFTLVKGVIKFKDKVWVVKNQAIQQRLVEAMHSSLLGGNFGIPATYSCIKHYFSWPGMKSSVTIFVQACAVCQKAKPDRARYPGLL